MSLLHIAGGATEDKLDASDVFSTYLYTGNGSTQTINNGIDLAGEGGLVWIKNRGATTNNLLLDTARGSSLLLISNLTNAQLSYTGLNSFNSNGFDLNVDPGSSINAGGSTYASWTFRKAPKFFDVVTYTGDGVVGRQIPHSLGIAPGMVVVKRIDSSGIWAVYHRGTGAAKVLQLEDTGAAYSNSAYWNNTEPSDAGFTVGNNAYVNTNGGQYVAYLFAHDPSADGIIQCGLFSGNTTVTIGWEPQYIMMKRTDSTDDWVTIDSMRGCSVGGVDARLMPNLSSAEGVSNDFIDFTPTGFISKNLTGTYIYMVIKRPNKVPTSGTQVYNAIARTGTGAAATVTGVGFAPDLVISQNRQGNAQGVFFDRLRGVPVKLVPSGTNAETTTDTTSLLSFNMNGISTGTDIASGCINSNTWTYINHFFKRAKGFFDIVCYTGTGEIAGHVQHSFGGKPELTICKARNALSDWWVSYGVSGTRWSLKLNAPTWLYENQVFEANAGDFPVIQNGSFTYNASGVNYVAYLFASLPGISKVGSYTGNGASQTINCGFSTGARFVLIKRTDSTGDWYIWDTARGIVAANDPHLSLNTTAAEVTTDDSIDPAVEGFICNQNTATNINVNGGSYIYLAIA